MNGFRNSLEERPEYVRGYKDFMKDVHSPPLDLDYDEESESLWWLGHTDAEQEDSTPYGDSEGLEYFLGQWNTLEDN
jgi:hypothetical protein